MSAETDTKVLPAGEDKPDSGNGTSSAFKSLADPAEDWTQISDLAERRRIQNRIAQRNYRKLIPQNGSG